MSKKQTILARKIARFLPLYIDLRTFKRILYSKPKGYTLAVWNCGDGSTLRTHLRYIQIPFAKTVAHISLLNMVMYDNGRYTCVYRSEK